MLQAVSECECPLRRKAGILLTLFQHRLSYMLKIWIVPAGNTVFSCHTSEICISERGTPCKASLRLLCGVI